MFILTWKFTYAEVNLEIMGTVKDDPTMAHSFSMGDNVEVCVGDLENLQAKIVAIDGTMITVMPKHQDLKVCMTKEK